MHVVTGLGSLGDGQPGDQARGLHFHQFTPHGEDRLGLSVEVKGFQTGGDFAANDANACRVASLEPGLDLVVVWEFDLERIPRRVEPALFTRHAGQSAEVRALATIAGHGNDGQASFEVGFLPRPRCRWLYSWPLPSKEKGRGKPKQVGNETCHLEMLRKVRHDGNVQMLTSASISLPRLGGHPAAAPLPSNLLSVKQRLLVLGSWSPGVPRGRCLG